MYHEVASLSLLFSTLESNFFVCSITRSEEKSRGVRAKNRKKSRRNIRNHRKLDEKEHKSGAHFLYQITIFLLNSYLTTTIGTDFTTPHAENTPKYTPDGTSEFQIIFSSPAACIPAHRAITRPKLSVICSVYSPA